MKNNVICILVDSVIADYFGKTRCFESPTPFIDSLRSEGLVANNMYSHGPYTDAATKSLYTGRNCLDDFAFYFRLESAPADHYKVFHDNGYETYGLYYPYYVLGPKTKKNIDHSFYTAGFIYKSEWNEIYKYYSSKLAKTGLKDDDKLLLHKRTQLMFEAWSLYYEEILSNPQSLRIIKSIFDDFDVNKAYDFLTTEYQKYKAKPDQYLFNLLSEGLEHPLAKLDNLDVDIKIDRNKLSLLYKDEASFFTKISKLNFSANFSRHLPSFRRIYKGVCQCLKDRNLESIKFLANYWCLLNDVKLFKKHSFLKHWQDLPSARTQLECAAEILEERGNRNKPFYMSLHLLDPHNYVSFFSYDNLLKAKEEIAVLNKYVDMLGSEFDGAISYILSIRYVDYCIKLFCEKLKAMGIWDNTTIMIIADHGSSYSFSPLHGPRVNTFDKECYHVPFIIRSPGFAGCENNDYYNSKDIFPTLFDMVGIQKPKSFIGHSIFDKSYTPQNYVITEYTGPGCPDLLNRRIWFSIRDCSFVIGYKVGIFENFEDGEISVVYDLSKDPNGYYDIKKTIDKTKLTYLLKPLKRRFEEVKINTKLFIKALKDNEGIDS